MAAVNFDLLLVPSSFNGKTQSSQTHWVILAVLFPFSETKNFLGNVPVHFSIPTLFNYKVDVSNMNFPCCACKVLLQIANIAQTVKSATLQSFPAV